MSSSVRELFAPSKHARHTLIYFCQGATVVLSPRDKLKWQIRILHHCLKKGKHLSVSLSFSFFIVHVVYYRIEDSAVYYYIMYSLNDRGSTIEPGCTPRLMSDLHCVTRMQEKSISTQNILGKTPQLHYIFLFSILRNSMFIKVLVLDQV